MKIYVDVILLINFFFDFLLLFVTGLILKRKIKLIRIFVASLVASLSVLLLFVNISSFELFLFKIVISIIMIWISFEKKDFLKNIACLYFVSIILGGFLYFLNLQTSYKNEGLIFFNNGFSINIIVLLIVSPIIFVYYYKQNRYLDDTVSNVHNVKLYLSDKVYDLRAYLDTGNKLYEPFKNREVIIFYNEELYNSLDYYLIIPFNTLADKGILRGKIANKIIIDNKYIFKDVVIGITNNKFSLDDSEVILHANYKNRI